MIRKIIFLFMVTAYLPAHAQFAGGVSAGLNFCQVDGDTYGGFSKIGLNAGGFVYYNLNERVGLQTEILFSSRGAREANSFYHLRLNYIDWVILCNFTLLGNENQSLVLQGGIVPGYLLYARSGFGIFQDATSTFRRIDMGFTAGATFRATQNLSIVSRFGYSLFDILSTADGSTSAKWVNRYLSLAVRWEWR